MPPKVRAFVDFLAQRFDASLNGEISIEWVLVLVVVDARWAGAGGRRVPFVVSPDSVTLAMLQAAKVTNEDYVIDLGSGDGRIVILAARRFGARGLGIEIIEGLVEKSRANARNAGVASRVSFRNQDLHTTDLSPASVITLYLLPEVNMQLRPKLLQLRAGTRVVSHDFDMGDWEPDKTITVDARTSRSASTRRASLPVIVPARGRLVVRHRQGQGRSLAIAQRHQHVRSAARGGDRARARGTHQRQLDPHAHGRLGWGSRAAPARHSSGGARPRSGATFVRAKAKAVDETRNDLPADCRALRVARSLAPA